MYNVSFQRLLEDVEETKEDIFEDLEPVIRRSPNNDPRDVELLSSEQDRLNLQNKSSWGLCSRVVSSRVPEYLLGSELQFRSWYELDMTMFRMFWTNIVWWDMRMCSVKEQLV